MIHELGQTFFISEAKDAYAICNIILPNADQHDREYSSSRKIPRICHHLFAILFQSRVTRISLEWL